MATITETDNVLPFRAKPQVEKGPALGVAEVGTIAACLCEVFGAFGGAASISDDEAEITLPDRHGRLVTVKIRIE